MNHAHNFIDLTGQRFSRLTVVSCVGKSKNNAATWLCQCDCGNETIVVGRSLRQGVTQSCGCYNLERLHLNFGKNHPMYGKHHSEESKKKISKSMKGKNVGARLDISGKNHPRWNPNLTNEERLLKRNYSKYTEWRTSVYERDSYTCQVCNRVGGKLNAHHLESYRDNPELRTTLSNGVTLCKRCHKNFHHQFGRGDNTKKQFEEFIIGE